MTVGPLGLMSPNLGDHIVTVLFGWMAAESLSRRSAVDTLRLEALEAGPGGAGLDTAGVSPSEVVVQTL